VSNHAVPVRALTPAERRREVDSAMASARAEGLDPAEAQPVFDAWARGEINTNQMIAGVRALAVGEQPRAPQAA